MPQFAPSAPKTAVAPITVQPVGLSCEAELFLGPDELTKVTTSGRIPFASTGASQEVRLLVAMPSEEGTYHVFIDVYAAGLLIAAYKAVQDVVIVAEAPLIAGEIIESYWRLYDEEIHHPHYVPIPYHADYYMCFKIRNMGNVATSFRMAYYRTDYGAGWYYSSPIELNPGQEGVIEWVFWATVTGTRTWYLYGNDTQVDSITITGYVI